MREAVKQASLAAEEAAAAAAAAVTAGSPDAEDLSAAAETAQAAFKAIESLARVDLPPQGGMVDEAGYMTDGAGEGTRAN